MHELQGNPVNEPPTTDIPICADLMILAERELVAFTIAVTELFGSEHAELSAEVWLDELLLMNTLPGSTCRDWRLVTTAALARLANRFIQVEHSGTSLLAG
jgi:hypothetical protein